MNEIETMRSEIPEDDSAHRGCTSLIFTPERMAELKREVGSGDYERYTEVMNRLITDLRPYAEYRISLQLARFYGRAPAREELEDPFQEVCIALHTGIASFLRNDDADTGTDPQIRVYQRQSWLKLLIWRTVRDWLKKESRGGSDLSIEAGLENGREPGYDPIAALEDSVSSDVLDEIIRRASALRVGPEAVLGFLYHSVVFYLLGDSGKKSKPEKTAAFLNRFTLGQLRGLLPRALLRSSGAVPSPGVFAELDKKLKGRENEKYHYEAAKLSTSASYIRRKLQGSR